MEKSAFLHENAQYWFDIDLARVRLALAKTKLLWRTAHITCATVKLLNLYICEKSRKKISFSNMKCSILVLCWSNIGTILYVVTVCGKYIRLLAHHRMA